MLRSIAVLILLAFSASAMAEGPSYNYVQASYIEVDIDGSGLSVDGDGLGIGGSFEFGDSWHFFGGYQTADFNFGVDFDQLLIGGGFHTALTENADFVANIAFTRVEASGFGSSVDDDGFAAQIGVRGMLTDRFELAGFINQTELDNFGGDTSVSGEAWYSFTENFAAGLHAEAGDDLTTYGIGVRLYFGQ